MESYTNIIIAAILFAVILFLSIIARKKIVSTLSSIFKRNKTTSEHNLLKEDTNGEKKEKNANNEVFNDLYFELKSLKKELVDKNIINQHLQEDYDAIKAKNAELFRDSFSLSEKIKQFENLKNEKCLLENEKTALSQRLLEKQREYENLRLEKQQSKTDERTFTVQSLMTAGPRKSDRDNELGEDVSGFLTKGDNLFFWILDGTSDESFIELDNVGEVFSCRKLALELSYNLAEQAIKKEIVSTTEWIGSAVRETLQEWKNRLEQNLIAVERKVKTVVTFKTTLAAGIWNKKNNSLEAFRIGDSKVVAFNSRGKVPLFNEEEKDQVTFQIKRQFEKINVVAFDNSDTIQVKKADDIVGLIAFSDGLSRSSEKIISEDIHQWTDILNNKKQFTNDDKSVLIATLI